MRHFRENSQNIKIYNIIKKQAILPIFCYIAHLRYAKIVIFPPFSQNLLNENKACNIAIYALNATELLYGQGYSH